MSTNSNNPQQQPSVSVSQTKAVGLVQVKDIALPEVSAPIISEVTNQEGGAGDYITTICNRWTPVSNFKWAKGTAKEIKLPLALNRTHHLQRILTSWSFWRCDFEIQVHVNATKFHVGQLAVCYLYNVLKDELPERIAKGVFCNMPGTFVYAGSNNVVELSIPYQHIYPYRSVDEENWVSVYIANYAQLMSGSAESSVDVTVYARAKNVRFGGLIAQPQMLSLMRALVRGGEAALKEIGADLNRDKPVDPSAPLVVISRNTQSWCAGENYVENLNVLRMDIAAQHSHRTRSDQMQVRELVSRFGLLAMSRWKTTDSRYKVLFTTRVAPTINFSGFKTDKEGMDAPIGSCSGVEAVSSLFTYWRGSLEYRVDIIASAYHTGKLGLRFIPGETNDETEDKLLGSYGQDFSLDGITSIRFVVPFIHKKSWLRVYDQSRTSAGESIGRFVIFVINPLVNIENVTPTLDVYVHVRGHEDFELGVPNVPVLSLPYERSLQVASYFTLTNFQTIFAVEWKSGTTNSSWYLARTKSPGGNGDYSFQILYPKKENYDLLGKIKTTYPGSWGDLPYKSSGVTYAVRPEGIEWTKGVPDSEGATRWYGKILVPKGYEVFTKLPLDLSDAQFEVKQLYPATFAQAGEEIGERSVSFPIVTPRVEIFNESFKDLKTFCRRYNLYAECVVRLNKGFHLERTILNIPVYPDGLELDTRSGTLVSSALNLCRHAPISVLCSAYKYFRGGLRYKIVARATKVGENQKVDLLLSYIHVPDMVSSKRRITSYLDGGRQYFSNGCAQYVQNIGLNEVIEIEIPQYTQSEYIMLGRCEPKDRYEHSLGTIVVSSKSEIYEALDLTVTVYWSFADDARMYCYQGFPRLCTNPYAREIKPDGEVEERFDLDYNNDASHRLESVSLSETCSQHSEYSELSEIDLNIPIALPQALVASPESWILGQTEIDAIGTRLDESMEKFVSRIHEIAQPFMNKLTDEIKNRFEFWLSGFIGQMTQVILNPCIKSVAVAVTTLVVQMGQLFFPGENLVSQVSHTLIKVYKQVVALVFPKQPTQGEIGTDTSDIFSHIGFGEVNVASPQDSMADEAHVIGATLISALATIFGVTSGARQHGCAWVLQHLRKDLHGFAMTSNALVVFFSNNLSLICKVGKYFSNLIHPEATLTGMVIDQREYIESFIKSVDQLCEPLAMERVRGDYRYQQKVYELSVAGDQLSAAYVNSARRSPAFDLINNRCMKVKKLMNVLVKDAMLPGVKYEPFVIHIVGPPKIGKSRLVDELATQLLTSIGYYTMDEPVYVKTPGVKHWNCLNGQPVLLIDDFYFSQDTGAEQCQALFCLKSAAAFNPEQAGLEDKKRFYAPKIVILCGNDAFPRPTDIMNLDALYRRRDVLVSAQMIYDGDIETIPTEKLDRFEHLRFSMHPKPRDPDMYDDFTNKGTGNFQPYEYWIRELVNKFKAYNIRELGNVKKRMSRMNRLFPPTEILEQEDMKTCRESFEQLQRKLIASNEVEFASLFQQVAREGVSPREIVASRPQAGEDEDPLVNVPTEVYGFTGNPTPVDLDVIYEVPATKPLTYKTRKGTEELREFKAMNLLPTDKRPYSFPQFDALNPNCIHPCVTHERVIWDFENKLFRNSSTGMAFSEVRCESRCRWDNPENRLSFYRCFATDYFEQYESNVMPIRKLPEGLVVNDWIIEEIAQKHQEEDGLPHTVRIERDGRLVHENVLPELEPSIVEWFQEKMKSIRWWSLVTFARRVVKWLALAAVGVGAFFLARNALGGEKGANSSTTTTSTTPLYPPINVAFDIGHGESSNYTPTDRPRHSGGVRDRRSALAALKSQLLHADPEAKVEDSPAIGILRRNFGIIRTVHESGKVSVVRCLGVCGTTILTVEHAFKVLDSMVASDIPTFEVSFGGSGWIRVRFESNNIYQFRNSQLCMYELPKSVPAFRDIRRHICTMDQHATTTGASIIGYVGFSSSGTPIVDLHHVEVRMTYGLAVDYGKTTEYLRKPVYQYSGFSAPGLCGSVLFGLEPKFQIYGLHCAGTGQIGFSEPIAKEMFARCSATPQCELSSLKPDKPPVTGILYLGKLAPGLAPVPPRKSKIVPSLVHGEIFPVTKFPAPLVKIDSERNIRLPEDPLFAGVAKHGLPPFEFPQELVNRARDDLMELLISVAPPVLSDRVEVVSEDIIFNGIPGVKGYTHLQLGTSEGFPLVLQRPEGVYDKRWLFEYEDFDKGRRLIKIKPELQEIMDVNMSLRKKGVVPPTMFQDCLKDNRVSKAKLNVPGSTRVFSISPVEFTFAVKKYYGHFAAAYARARPLSQTAVGINPNGPEWSALYRHMLVFGRDRMVTGDYKAFGDRLQSQCVIAAFELMDKWYEYFYEVTEESRTVRRIIREELLHVPHLALGHVYRMFCGIPSGFALTVELNSIVNCLYMRIVWSMIYAKTEMGTMEKFNQLTRLVTYGDDLLMSVHPKAEEFNFVNIKMFLEQYGIGFTCSDKSREIDKPFETIEEVSFLKRGFVPHPFRKEMMAPLDPDSVKDCVNWIAKTADPLTATIENLRAVNEMAYSLGEPEHNAIREKMIRHWGSKYKEHLRLKTWGEIDDLVWGFGGWWLSSQQRLGAVDEKAYLDR